MSSRTTTRIAVLMGGPSAERDVSLVSGRECAKALRAEGYDVSEIDAGESLCDDLRAANPDVVFNALHGRWGEDGCVQGVLEWLRIPYTHSGVLASSLAMDKERTKAAYRSVGLPVAESLLTSAEAARAEHPMKPPYVVKPYNEGSSVGVYIVHEAANGPAKLSDDMPETVMVEEFVPGRELTCSVMGDRALVVTDIYSEGWYDFHAKYSEGGSRHVVPAALWCVGWWRMRHVTGKASRSRALCSALPSWTGLVDAVFSVDAPVWTDCGDWFGSGVLYGHQRELP